MSKKRKKRKEWPPYKYWTEHIMQYGELWLTGEEFEKTINHRLAIILLRRNGEKITEKAVDEIAIKLEQGRNKAIDMFWEGGLDVYVVGNNGRIEGITVDNEYRGDHFKRMADMDGWRQMGIGRKSKTATIDERRNYGLPTVRKLTTIKRRLLIGGSHADVTIKQLEIKKVKIKSMEEIVE